MSAKYADGKGKNMTIDDLINGVNLAIQGRVEVRRLAENGYEMETIYEGTDGFSNVPQDIADAEIAYLFSESDHEGDAVLVVDIGRDED